MIAHRSPLLAVPLALLLALGAGAGAAGAAPRIWAGLRPGPDAVGFTAARADTIDVSVWYPAQAGGAPMRLADVESTGAGLAAFLQHNGLSAAAAEAYAGAPLLARRDAAPRAGAFPVLLIAQGNDEGAIDQAVLAEFLASFGYVVATTPSPMRRFPLTDESGMGMAAERQASELAQALALVGRMPGADASRVGVLGHSFGARAALLLAMREPRVAALVSLDGGIGTATGMESLRRAPSFDASRARLPILHLYEELDAFMHPDFTLLRELKARRLALERVRDLHHVHFTTLGFGAAVSPEIARLTHAGPRARQGVLRVAGRTLAFFRQYVR